LIWAYLEVSVLELLCLDLLGEKRFASHSTLLTLVSEFCDTTRWLDSIEAVDLGGGRVILKMQSTRLSKDISGFCSSSVSGSVVVVMVVTLVVVVVVGVAVMQVSVVVDSFSGFSAMIVVRFGVLHSG
jgi:hypothetical protein